MPTYAGAVARLLQQPGVSDVLGRERRVVVDDAVEMAIAAGQVARPARGAERIDDEGVAEADALTRQPVHVRCLQPGEAPAFALLALDDPHRIPALVVGVDEDEIRPPRLGTRRPLCQQTDRERRRKRQEHGAQQVGDGSIVPVHESCPSSLVVTRLRSLAVAAPWRRGG